MSESTTAERILDLLESFGVDTTFGLPGVHNLPFWAELNEDDARPGGLRIIGVRHEQTAAYAADGLARATGGLGVALVTSGPGAANTLAAFGEAAASGIPLLVIASDVPERMRDRTKPRGLLHESADQGAWFAPLAKQVLQPTTPEAAIDAARTAIVTAMSHPRGPVYLGIPADVLAAAAPPPAPVRIADAPSPTPSELTQLTEVVSASRRPLLWIGGGAVSSDAAQAIDAFAWRLGSPVVSTYAGRGVMAVGHPLLADAPPHEPAVRALLGEADLLIGLGSAFDGMTTANWSLPRPPVVADVNVSPSQGWHPDVTVAADVKQTLDALTIRIAAREPWADSPFTIRDAVRRDLATDARTSPALDFVRSVESAWPPGHATVCDMAVAGYWVGGYAAVHHPRRLLYPVGWGTLGYALPAAIGVAAAGIHTLAVVGDGGLAMALGELATIAEQHLPITILVVDDGGYGMLRFDQQRAGRPERGVDLRSPGWRELGAAFSMPVDLPQTMDDLRNVVTWSAMTGDPRLVIHTASLYPPRSTSPRWAD